MKELKKTDKKQKRRRVFYNFVFGFWFAFLGRDTPPQQVLCCFGGTRKRVKCFVVSCLCVCPCFSGRTTKCLPGVVSDDCDFLLISSPCLQRSEWSLSPVLFGKEHSKANQNNKLLVWTTTLLGILVLLLFSILPLTHLCLCCLLYLLIVMLLATSSYSLITLTTQKTHTQQKQTQQTNKHSPKLISSLLYFLGGGGVAGASTRGFLSISSYILDNSWRRSVKVLGKKSGKMR